MLLTVGLWVAPLATFAGVLPGVRITSLSLIALWLIIVAGDFIYSKDRLKSVGISTQEVTRMTHMSEGKLELDIINEKMRIKKLRLGLALPEYFKSEKDDLWVVLPDDHPMSRVFWSCTPHKTREVFSPGMLP